MKLGEFIDTANRHQRRLRRAFMVVVGPVFLGFLAYVILMPWVLKEIWPAVTRETTQYVLLASLMLAYGLVMYLLHWYSKQAGSETGLPCPQCKRNLAAPHAKGRVIASKCCPHCQVRVIDEDGAQAEPGQLLGAEAFRAGARRYERWGLAEVLAPLLFMMLGGGAAVIWMRTWLGPKIGWHEFYMLALVLLVLAVITGWWCVGLEKRVNRRWGIKCLHCAANLARHPVIVKATGCCPDCGGHVLEEPARGT